MEAVGHDRKECWQLMLRRRGRALCRQLRPRRRLVKQRSWAPCGACGAWIPLEFPWSIVCRLLKYEKEGKVQKCRQWQTSWQKQGWKRTPVECFKGHLEGNSTWNWPQSLNQLKTTVTCLESSRRKDLPKPVQSWQLFPQQWQHWEQNVRCSARKCVQQGPEWHHTKWALVSSKWKHLVVGETGSV